jgi:hypothetical protein
MRRCIMCSTPWFPVPWTEPHGPSSSPLQHSRHALSLLAASTARTCAHFSQSRPNMSLAPWTFFQSYVTSAVPRCSLTKASEEAPVVSSVLYKFGILCLQNNLQRNALKSTSVTICVDGRRVQSSLVIIYTTYFNILQTECLNVLRKILGLNYTKLCNADSVYFVRGGNWISDIIWIRFRLQFISFSSQISFVYHFSFSTRNAGWFWKCRMLGPRASVVMKGSLFWEITPPCTPLKVNRRFGWLPMDYTALYPRKYDSSILKIRFITSQYYYNFA